MAFAPASMMSSAAVLAPEPPEEGIARGSGRGVVFCSGGECVLCKAIAIYLHRSESYSHTRMVLWFYLMGISDGFFWSCMGDSGIHSQRGSRSTRCAIRYNCNPHAVCLFPYGHLRRACRVPAYSALSSVACPLTNYLGQLYAAGGAVDVALPGWRCAILVLALFICCDLTPS